MALEDALKHLEMQPGDAIYGYISRKDLQEVVRQIYADRLAGDPGPVGPKGDQGDIGPRGYEGTKGKQGQAGKVGPAGPAGPESIDTVVVQQGGAFGSAPNAVFDQTTHTLTLELPEGPPGPAAVVQGIKGTVTKTDPAPTAANGDIYVIVGEAPSWAPFGDGDLIIKTATTWANLGPLSTWQVSDDPGSVLTVDSKGWLKHTDGDHAGLYPRTEAVAALDVINQELAERIPVAGGTATGPIVGVPTTWQDPDSVLVSRDFLVDNFLKSQDSGTLIGDLTVTGNLRARTLKVDTVVSDLRVASTTAPQGALGLQQAQSLFANKVHKHPEMALKAEVITEGGGTLKGTLTLDPKAVVLSENMGIYHGVRIAPDVSGRPDVNRSFYFDFGHNRFIITAPPSGESTLEVQSPITQREEPQSPEHVANKKYVDAAAALAEGRATLHFDQRLQDSRDDLLAEIARLEGIINSIKKELKKVAP